MSLNAVGNLLSEVVKDRETSSKDPPSWLYASHLKALDNWYTELPIYLCLQAQTSGGLVGVDPESNDRQKTAIVWYLFYC